MKERKEKKRFGLIVFIVIIMIGTSFSFVFFGFSPSEDKVKYNNFLFTLDPKDKIWLVKVDNRVAAFSFLPNEVTNIMDSDDSIQKLRSKIEIDVTSDINNTFKEAIALAQHQMSLTLEKYNIYVRKGFTTNTSFNLPVINCKIATQNAPVVYFNQGDSTHIHSEGSCIILEASTNADFIKVKDRLMYGILGVIK